MTGDGGRWLRRQCLILARANATPVDYWLAEPLPALMQWIKVHNELAAEAGQKK